MSTTTTATVGQRLGRFAAELSIDRLPDAVTEKLRCNVLHNLACALGAHDAGEPVWATLRDRGPAEATILCDGGRVAVEHAAFANGALMHTRAQDDTHFAAKTHVGSAVMPAALALAEREGRSGADFAVAVVAGCEVAAAVGERLAAAATARGFRATPVFGTLGAAAAAASILGLDGAQTADAIAIASSFSAGLNQTWIDGSSEYRLELGMAARNGIVAAELATAGLSGASHWYEGDAGFARAFAGLTDVAGGDWELGERWRLLDVTYKPYPVCAITQSPVQVAIDLATDNDLAPADIASIRCVLNSADRTYPGTVNPGPFQDIGATLMSAQFCVAMALKGRGATLAGLREFDDPELMRLVSVTDVVGEDGIPNLGTRVELTTVDGRELKGELIPDDSTYGWDWDGVVANLYRMAPEMAVPQAGLEALVDTVSRLTELRELAPVTAATVPVARTSKPSPPERS
jgi:2-methylcitrate dehydratase PrpD